MHAFMMTIKVDFLSDLDFLSVFCCCTLILLSIADFLHFRDISFFFAVFARQLVRMSERGQDHEVDIFRDTPLRYLGYANEIGEAFRSVIDKKLVWASYGVASLYVLADTVSKAAAVWKSEDQNTRNKEAVKIGADVLLWQSFASVIIPGITINRVCAGTKYLLKRSPLHKLSKPLTVAVGLASIPLIIHPIDRGVDHAMDVAIRPYLKDL